MVLFSIFFRPVIFTIFLMDQFLYYHLKNTIWILIRNFYKSERVEIYFHWKWHIIMHYFPPFNRLYTSILSKLNFPTNILRFCNFFGRFVAQHTYASFDQTNNAVYQNSNPFHLPRTEYRCRWSGESLGPMYIRQVSVMFIYFWCWYIGANPICSTIRGRIDQVNQVLFLDQASVNATRYNALDRWTNQLNTLHLSILNKMI